MTLILSNLVAVEGIFDIFAERGRIILLILAIFNA